MYGGFISENNDDYGGCNKPVSEENDDHGGDSRKEQIDMWNSFLEGKKAVLQDKKRPIKIKEVSVEKKGKEEVIKIIVDKEQMLAYELQERLSQNAEVSVNDTECTIQYKYIEDSHDSEEIKDHIRNICKKYGYTTKSKPSHQIKGYISVIPEEYELAAIIDRIKEEFFGYDIKAEISNNEIRLPSDFEYEYLKKIVTQLKEYRLPIDIENATKIAVPLLPADAVVMKKIQGISPKKISKDGNLLVITFDLPIGGNADASNIFHLPDFKFVKCIVDISVNDFEEDKFKIEGIKPQSGHYYWTLLDIEKAKKPGYLYKAVMEKYPNEKPISIYKYYFSPIIKKEELRELKSNNSNKEPRITIDVPSSCAIIKPHTKDEYNRLMAEIKIMSSTIKPGETEYEPTAKIKYTKEYEKQCEGLLKLVKMNLEASGIHFSTCERGITNLVFSYIFTNSDDRDSFLKRLCQDVENNNALLLDNLDIVSTWTFSQGDEETVKELNIRLQSSYKDEDVIYMSKENFKEWHEEICKIKNEKDRLDKEKNYIKSHGLELGKCKKRSCDEITITLKEDSQIRKDAKQMQPGDVIYFPLKGETAELKRQARSMKRIMRYRKQVPPQNPRLSDFIFNADWANRIEEEDIKHTKHEINATKISNDINAAQLEAAAKAVLAEDIAILQGPPGTGKTTVIAEIIYQVLKENPNSRILLTSQTNLAVDNALERLNGETSIRPIRIGDPDTMEPEGRKYYLPFIEKWANPDSENEKDENAVSMWINKIRKNIAIQQQENPEYEEALSSWAIGLEKEEKDLRKQFTELYKRHINLFAATCSKCGSTDFFNTYSAIYQGSIYRENSFDSMYFDVVIMDEASKATPLEMAVPLVLGKKIVLVGDHKQLPPMMDEDTIDSALIRIGRKELAIKLRNAKPQFKILFDTAPKSIRTTLDTQYRSDEQIMRLFAPFYEDDIKGGLKCGVKKGGREHGISNTFMTPEDHAIWVNVEKPETALNPGYKNIGEVEAIKTILDLLQNSKGFNEYIAAQKKKEDKEIGIITFYKAQYREIKNKLGGNNDQYRINVVDKFQGMERNIVIISTVRSNSSNSIGFAKEIERVNVAFSRAKTLLIVIGNKKQFAEKAHYKKYDGAIKAALNNMKTVSFEKIKNAAK